MKRKPPAEAQVASETPPAAPATGAETRTDPSVFEKLESFKKELDAIKDLGHGGRWARAIRNIKDMQKDLGALAKEIQMEYLETIE